MDPTPEGAQHLASIWQRLHPRITGKPGLFSGLGRLITRKNSLILNKELREFFRANIPPDINTFGDLYQGKGVRVYTCAVCMETARLVAFGDNENDLLIDGAMASIALPIYYPPWKVGEHRYLDGGLVSKLPLCTAIERGATQVIGIDVRYKLDSLNSGKDIFGIGGYTLALSFQQQVSREVARAQSSGVDLRIFTLNVPEDVPFWDYTQSAYLYQLGKKAIASELKSNPLEVRPSWQLFARQRLVDVFNHLLGAPTTRVAGTSGDFSH
jgi:predicted acylesterase/phospholipase RssA